MGSESGVHRPRDAASESDIAIGDGVVAVLGGLTLLLSLALVGNPGLMGALLLVVVLCVLTGVAAYTAVAGRSPSPVTRVLAGMFAASGFVGVFFAIDHPLIIAVPLLALAAGMGRTRSWRLRLLGVIGVVGLVVVTWVTG